MPAGLLHQGLKDLVPGQGEGGLGATPGRAHPPASEGSSPPASKGVQPQVKDTPAGSASSVHPQPPPQTPPPSPQCPGLRGRCPRADDSSLARPQPREICMLTGNSASG